MAYQNILVIINPVSGTHDPAATRELIVARLVQAGIAHEVRETHQAGDAFGWAQAAVRERFDLVLVSGGDGTVMEVLSGLLKSKTDVPLAQIPAGTANLLARALNIPIDHAEALNVALTGTTTRIDVGYLPDKDRYFAIVAGAGYDAQMIADASRELKNVLGFLAYIVSGVKNLFKLKPARITLEIDGRRLHTRAHTVLVVNVGQLGDTPLALGPNITPNDGKLNLLVASSASVLGALGVLARVATRRYQGHPNLRYYHAAKVRIDALPPLATQLDGEALGTTPLIIETVPQGALLVVPHTYTGAATARSQS